MASYSTGNTLFLFFSILIALQRVSTFSDLEFEEFVAKIEETVKEAENYVLPVDNEAFFTPDDLAEPKAYGSYDFIIIGGGTAGGVLANRLTEENFTVLVVEAGKEDPPAASVLGLAKFLHYTEYNWGYNTTKQTHSCLNFQNQQCFYPRGKALGGTSIINFGKYARGNPKDFDKWGESWSYKDVLPYFKKSERAKFTVDIDKDYHGFAGPQSIQLAEDVPDLTINLLNAVKELGQPELDYNGPHQLGVGREQSYIDFNIRSSTSHSYIRPALNRSNLFIALESLVTKILITSKVAQGVEFVHKGRKYRAKARKEVILSAGAINSPQVLMLSGIGPKEELNKLNLPIIADLPVGENLLEHALYTGLYVATEQMFSSNNSLRDDLELWRDAKRPLNSAAGAQVISFWNYHLETFFILPGRDPNRDQYTEKYREAMKSLQKPPDLIVALGLLHPKSSGRVTLQSNNARDFPLIDPNTLSKEEDVATMYQGIQRILALNDTEVFKRWGASLVPFPSPYCKNHKVYSKAWWYCGLRSISSTIYHPIGTTRMGKDPSNSVVNADLKVHGIRKLRVVDAGVMPSHITGHANAPVVMIAEKIADVIKSDYGQ